MFDMSSAVLFFVNFLAYFDILLLSNLLYPVKIFTFSFMSLLHTVFFLSHIMTFFTCGTHGGGEGRGGVLTGFGLGGPKAGDHWEDLGVGGRITLRWTLGR
jgi:hypothetical protein